MKRGAAALFLILPLALVGERLRRARRAVDGQPCPTGRRPRPRTRTIRLRHRDLGNERWRGVDRRLAVLSNETVSHSDGAAWSLTTVSGSRSRWATRQGAPCSSST